MKKEPEVVRRAPRKAARDRQDKHVREGKLLELLQREHGYTLMEPSSGMEKTQLMFDRKTRKMEVAFIMRLAVPAESALGLAIAKMRKDKVKAKKP